jgi:predicted amidohydrolase YtcJ
MREGYHCWTQVVRQDLVTNRADALAQYAAKAAELDDGRWIWTTAGGWNLNQLDVPVIFTFAELNAAAPANPLWITGSGFAGPRVNQAALDALGLVPGSPGVVLGPGGVPTGQLTSPATTAANQAILAQLNALGIDGEAECLSDFLEEANSRGLTAWKDAGGNDAPWGTGGAINDQLHVEEGANQLRRDGGLNVRIAFNAMSGYDITRVVPETQNLQGFLGDEMFKYLGPGEDVMEEDPGYHDFTRYSAGRRLSVETHVGDVDMILDGFEAGNTVYPIGELKWRIAHPGNGLPNDTQLARGKALGIGWALTFSAVRNGATGPRYKTTMENSDHMCLATDAMNVAPWAPFQSLWYVTTGQTMLPGVSGVPADQRLTREQALRHATVECAWFLDLDGKLGTLEPGMLADMIVLSDDYFTVPDNAIKDIRSLLTVVDGRVVSADGEYSGLD